MGAKKLNIAVLGSTRGTDMEAVADAVKRGELNADIKMVVSDKEDAFILQRAENHGIEAVFIDPGKFKKREDFDREIVRKLQNKGIDLILLIGYMRILSPYFVRQYKNKIMNIHPSLLPAFGGGMDLDVHQLVMDEGVKITGCTLHFVDEGTDTGPIIMQSAVGVEEDDTPESLKEKVQKAEKDVIVKAVRLFQEGLLKVEGGKVRVLGK